MSGRLGHNESMEHGQPNDGLRLQFEPFEKVLQVDFGRIVGVFEATAHRGLNVRAAKGRHFAQMLRDHDHFVQEEAEFARVAIGLLVRNQAVQV